MTDFMFLTITPKRTKFALGVLAVGCLTEMLVAYVGLNELTTDVAHLSITHEWRVEKQA